MTCETWDQCNSGIQATFCTIEGQGHEWPGTASLAANPHDRHVPALVTMSALGRAGDLERLGCFDGCNGATQDINATREMWNFFRRVANF